LTKFFCHNFIRALKINFVNKKKLNYTIVIWDIGKLSNSPGLLAILDYTHVTLADIKCAISAGVILFFPKLLILYSCP
jgi:hypothetical protein